MCVVFGPSTPRSPAATRVKSSAHHGSREEEVSCRRSPGSPLVRRGGGRQTSGQWLPWLPRWRRWDLLLRDGWGLSPFTGEARHDLFGVWDDRRPVRATAMAGQAPVDPWALRFPAATVGEAILDRLVRQAIRLPLTGESLYQVLATAGRSDATDSTPPGSWSTVSVWRGRLFPDSAVNPFRSRWSMRPNYAGWGLGDSSGLRAVCVTG